MAGIVIYLLNENQEEDQKIIEESINEKEEIQYTTLYWGNETYKRPILPYPINITHRIKIIKPSEHYIRHYKLSSIDIEAKDYGKAISYILLDENKNLIRETSYRPAFNYTPKNYGKHTFFMLAIYPDGERVYDQYTFTYEFKMPNYYKPCPWQGNTTIFENTSVNLSCDLIVPANHTLIIRNSTISFEGVDAELFYMFPNSSIGYEIRVLNGGRLIAYNSSFTAHNGYWNGFIFENGSIVDWYYNPGHNQYPNNKNISHAFRVGIVYQQIYGWKNRYWEYSNSYVYVVFIVSTWYDVLEDSIFYKIYKEDIIFGANTSKSGKYIPFKIIKL